MPDERELIRRALMGDKQAQEECTEKGIALPCPCCGRVEQAIINGSAVYHIHADCLMDARLVPLHKWNTRPTLPLGKCGECKCWQRNGSDWGNCSKWYAEDKVQAFMLEDDFCSSFEPREE